MPIRTQNKNHSKMVSRMQTRTKKGAPMNIYVKNKVSQYNQNFMVKDPKKVSFWKAMAKNNKYITYKEVKE